MASELQPEYNCAMKDLYEVCRLGLQNYNTYQAELATYKALYDAAWSTALKTAIDAAEAMPDDDARREPAVSFRIDVVKAGLKCTDKWQLLKGHIRTAWAQEYWEGKFAAAGIAHFEDALREDWESVKQLNVDAKAFMTANLAELTAGANMPAGFPAAYNVLADAFKTAYESFTGASDTGVATDAKIAANNAIFKTTMGMFTDAVTFFKREPAKRDMFVWTLLYESINPPIGGMKGSIKDAITSMPITAAEVTTKKEGEPAKSTVPDADGKYSLVLSDGDHVVTVKVTGKPDINDTVSVAGTFRTKNYTV